MSVATTLETVRPWAAASRFWTWARPAFDFRVLNAAGHASDEVLRAVDVVGGQLAGVAIDQRVARPRKPRPPSRCSSSSARTAARTGTLVTRCRRSLIPALAGIGCRERRVPQRSDRLDISNVVKERHSDELDSADRLLDEGQDGRLRVLLGIGQPGFRRRVEVLLVVACFLSTLEGEGIGLLECRVPHMLAVDVACGSRPRRPLGRSS